MAKGKATVEATTRSGLECVGKVCFDADGGITVKLPKNADPECAVAVAKTISRLRPVRFEVATPEVK